ncbi:MAG: hypothetical protein COT74_10775 [Bdellovibrionales bacterium CG10_big_fil_rev_8_21_14_0_10_45_34]|nr:MAG: hypothetical protein COT74_10775 [Bdellovibrionales bacterium CG10_big_fil_rev_8_21_14_0_10_45_34]
MFHFPFFRGLSVQERVKVGVFRGLDSDKITRKLWEPLMAKHPKKRLTRKPSHPGEILRNHYA